MVQHGTCMYLVTLRCRNCQNLSSHDVPKIAEIRPLQGQICRISSIGGFQGYLRVSSASEAFKKREKSARNCVALAEGTALLRIGIRVSQNFLLLLFPRRCSTLFMMRWNFSMIGTFSRCIQVGIEFNLGRKYCKSHLFCVKFSFLLPCFRVFSSPLILTLTVG